MIGRVVLPGVVWLGVVWLGAAQAGALAATLSGEQQASLDRMLRDLRGAPDEAAAAALERRIHTAWRNAGPPAARLLMERGLVAVQKNDGASAADDLDASLVLDPEYMEAFTARAAARLLEGDYQGAIRDAGEALRREPRNFAALQILSQVAEARGDWKGAYEAWRKGLELSPRTHDAQTRLNMLRAKAEGQAT